MEENATDCECILSITDRHRVIGSRDLTLYIVMVPKCKLMLNKDLTDTYHQRTT